MRDVVNSTNTPICRNSLSQFSKMASQVTCGEIAGHRDRCVSMLYLFAVVLLESGDQLSHEKQQKHHHQDQR